MSQKYLGYDDSNQTANAASMPPYVEITRMRQNIKGDRSLPSLKVRIETRNGAEKGQVVTFGSKILLIDWYFWPLYSETGSYLTAMHSKKSLGFDRPGIHQ